MKRTIFLGAALSSALLGCSSSTTTATTTPVATAAAATTTAASTTTVAPTTVPATTVAPTTIAPTTSAPTTVAKVLASWEQVKPGGDCQCSDKSEYSYFVHKGNPNKVLFFLEGGGACFSAETCGGAQKPYTTKVDLTADGLAKGEGIFDLANPKNPLADYSMVFVPYCTGDVHLGNTSKDYGNGVVIQHKGFVNASAALAGMAKTFPDAAEIVVAGESAGSVPTPLFAGLARDSYPKAKIVALADSSGAYPDLAGLNAAIIDGAWGGFKNVPKWPTNADVTPETWSFPGLYVRAGKHSPDIVFARHDYLADNVQAFFTALGGVAANELDKLILRNETEIEAKGQPVFSYLAPGTDHTVLHTKGFYTETVGGTPFVDWVTKLVNHQPIADVR